ncbi:hypothetical protein BP00DRAFT_306762, partial [Aspergillus indologenus CBS 114.80]
ANSNGNFLFFLFSILCSLLLFTSQTPTALAAPVSSIPSNNNNALDTLQLAARDKHIPTKAQVEELIQPAHLHEFSQYAKRNQPPKDKAIFFTGQPQKSINELVKWANGQHLTSVRDIWKNANFFQKGQYKEVDAATFTRFQQAFSKYYAQQTTGTAYLVFPHDKTPAKTGIFYSVELPEIIAHGKVDEIIWIDQDKIHDKGYDWKTETKVYWKK